MAAERGSTPEGRQAYRVLGWVNEDPAVRAGEGLDRLGKLATAAATTRGLHEIQDVARIVSRLAS